MEEDARPDENETGILNVSKLCNCFSFLYDNFEINSSTVQSINFLMSLSHDHLFLTPMPQCLRTIQLLYDWEFRPFVRVSPFLTYFSFLMEKVGLLLHCPLDHTSLLFTTFSLFFIVIFILIYFIFGLVNYLFSKFYGYNCWCFLSKLIQNFNSDLWNMVFEVLRLFARSLMPLLSYR
jgi:hypothetical protein